MTDDPHDSMGWERDPTPEPPDGAFWWIGLGIALALGLVALAVT